MRVAICDDKNECLIQTKSMIEKWSLNTANKIDIVDFDNADSLINELKTSHFDIIFLDIIMPLLNGVEAAKEVRSFDKNVRIVFLTSSPEFALQSYSVKATDYCIKPVTYNKIEELMSDCLSFCLYEPENLILKTINGYQKIYIHEIEYLEAQNKKVLIYLNNDRIMEVLEPLYTFENKLINTKGFFKCHRSYLVYIPSIDHFNNTEIRTKSNRTIPISRGYSKAFKDAYFEIMFK